MSPDSHSRIELSDERELLKRYAREPSPELRDELVARFMPLARKLAARYAGRASPSRTSSRSPRSAWSTPSTATTPSAGTTFSTFAVPTILGELRRHFRDRTWAIHMPRGLQETILEVEKAMEELPTRLGRAATVADIAERLGISEEKVLEALNASQTPLLALLRRLAADRRRRVDLAERANRRAGRAPRDRR